MKEMIFTTTVSCTTRHRLR